MNLFEQIGNKISKWWNNTPMMKYDRQEQARYRKTPEGAKLQDDLKNKGFLKTMKDLKKK
jgi:hypothetical protein